MNFTIAITILLKPVTFEKEMGRTDGKPQQSHCTATMLIIKSWPCFEHAPLKFKITMKFNL